MKDCRDLLTVYRTTRWPHRKYETVEEVKAEHTGSLLGRDGWLVAELNGTVVGEVTLRTESNPQTGTVGQITSLDVDVRYQRRSLGRTLTQAAEAVLRSKNASRVFVDSPPDAYNYWMKMRYFARGALVRIWTDARLMKAAKRYGLEEVLLDGADRLPPSMRFHNVASPGLLSSVAGRVIDGRQRGAIVEFREGGQLAGVGAAVRTGRDSTQFVADVTDAGFDCFSAVALRTMKIASRLGDPILETVVPSDMLETYSHLIPWKHESFTEIPLVRLL